MLFPFRNVRDVLGLHAKVSAHKPAIISYDASQNRLDLTYLEFVGKTHQIANFLYEDLSIKRGDMIAVASGNQENALLLYFATWVIGAAVLSIDTSQDEATVKQTLEDHSVRVLFVTHELLGKYIPIAQVVDSIEGIIQIGGDQREDYLRFEDLAANRPTTFLGDESGAKGADIPVTGGNERTASLDDLALITYKNGRMIRQTQGDLLPTANQLAQSTALTGNQTALAALPFHENFAASIMAPLFVGATLVLIEEFSADFFWYVIVKERVHTTVLNAARVQNLVDSAQQQITNGKMRFGGKIIQQDVKHFRHILISDTNLTSQCACDFEDSFGIPLITAYQHPETHAFLTLLPITLSWTHHQTCLHGGDNPSIGAALTNMAILDDKDIILGEGQIGRIAVQRDEAWEATGDKGYFRVDDNGERFFFLS